MDLKQIKQLIDLMKRSELSEFEVEEEGFKLKIKRDLNGLPASAPARGSNPPFGVAETSTPPFAAAATVGSAPSSPRKWTRL